MCGNVSQLSIVSSPVLPLSWPLRILDEVTVDMLIPSPSMIMVFFAFPIIGWFLMALSKSAFAWFLQYNGAIKKKKNTQNEPLQQFETVDMLIILISMLKCFHKIEIVTNRVSTWNFICTPLLIGRIFMVHFKKWDTYNYDN